MAEPAFAAPPFADRPPPFAEPPISDDPIDYGALDEGAGGYRRNPAKRWTVIAIIAALLMLAAVAAVSWFGLPGMADAGVLARRGGTPLNIALVGRPERRTLESGNELLQLSGRIENPTAEIQPVPQIRAELRDDAGRTVHQWQIAAPVPELQPRQSATFNSAEVDVPSGAKALSLSFGRVG